MKSWRVAIVGCVLALAAVSLIRDVAAQAPEAVPGVRERPDAHPAARRR